MYIANIIFCTETICKIWKFKNIDLCKYRFDTGQWLVFKAKRNYAVDQFA